MFEDLAAETDRRLIPYRPTAWATVPQSGQEPASADPEPGERPVSAGAFPRLRELLRPFGGEKNGILGSVRSWVSDREDWIVLAAVLLLVCDCQDDTELLITLAILFGPELVRLFT